MLIHACFFLNSLPMWLQKTAQCKGFFSLLLCSDFTSHVSVRMKIRFKDGSVSDDSAKVWNAQVSVAVMNICKVFSDSLSWKIKRPCSWALSSAAHITCVLQKSVREDQILGICLLLDHLLSKDCQCLQSSWLT